MEPRLQVSRPVWALIGGNDAGWVSSSIVIRLAAAFVFLAGWCQHGQRARTQVDRHQSCTISAQSDRQL
jgi:hypothetical protein